MTSIMPISTHIALALQLLALVAGCFLISKACAGEFHCKRSGQVVGWFVVIVSLLSIICLAYITIARPYDRTPKFRKEKMWQHPPVKGFHPPVKGMGEQMPQKPQGPK